MLYRAQSLAERYCFNFALLSKSALQLPKLSKISFEKCNFPSIWVPPTLIKALHPGSRPDIVWAPCMHDSNPICRRFPTRYCCGDKIQSKLLVSKPSHLTQAASRRCTTVGCHRHHHVRLMLEPEGLENVCRPMIRSLLLSLARPVYNAFMKKI